MAEGKVAPIPDLRTSPGNGEARPSADIRVRRKQCQPLCRSGTTIPSLEDVKKQTPQADCQVTSTKVGRNLTLSRDKPRFDNADFRRAVVSKRS